MTPRQCGQGACPPHTKSDVFVDRDACALASFFPVSRPVPRSFAIAFAALGLAGCGLPTAADTVDLGDNPEPPNITIDADFFHCRIQPEVITQFRCAPGGPDDGQMNCHAARSALRLVEVPTPARCQGGRVIGAAPVESEQNLERVRIEIGPDAESSPFYRRPLTLDSHPRRIFAEDSAAADLIRMWLNSGGT
jgi:hypothetical protein